MCTYGAPFKKPTMFKTNIPKLQTVVRSCCCVVPHGHLQGLCVFEEKGRRFTKWKTSLASKYTRPPYVVLWHERSGLLPLRSPFANMANRGLHRDGRPPFTGPLEPRDRRPQPSRSRHVRGALLLDGNRPSSSSSRTDQPSVERPPWKRSHVDVRGSVANEISRNTKAARRAALLGPADDLATFLKQRTVTVTTRILYLDCVEAFCKEMGAHAEELGENFSPNEIDQLLERYLGTLYVAGDGIAAARWAFYALAWFPVLPTKSPMILPRAKMTLKGFARQEPDLARDPGPWEAACIIAEHLAVKFGYEGILAAAATLLQLDLYTRPSETLNIEFQHVLPPERGANPDYARWAVIICPSMSTPGRRRAHRTTRSPAARTSPNGPGS